MWKINKEKITFNLANSFIFKICKIANEEKLKVIEGVKLKTVIEQFTDQHLQVSRYCCKVKAFLF